ncbi:MAG: hypothetical protein ACXWCX_28820, partial [Burkholderiales bacterium]
MRTLRYQSFDGAFEPVEQSAAIKIRFEIGSGCTAHALPLCFIHSRKAQRAVCERDAILSGAHNAC